MKLVISNPKTGKAYTKALESPEYLGMKIGQEISLDNVGLKGFKAKITGGSNADGFPMKPTLDGSGTKKLRMKRGVGFKPTKKGMLKRKRVAGKIVSDSIKQLNLVITKEGTPRLEEQLGKKDPENAKADEKKADAKTAKEKHSKKEKAETKPTDAKEEKPAKKEKAEEKPAEKEGKK